MVSDVLSDAVAEIEEYEREFPEVYAEMREEIATVKTAMVALRVKLDRPPLSLPS